MNENLFSPDEKVQISVLEGPELNLDELLKNPATLFVFYKGSCPTCSFLLPHLDYYYRRINRDDWLYFVSQDDHETTEKFVNESEFAVPVLLDFPDFDLSTGVDFQSVPAIFVIDEQRQVRTKTEGFIREDFVNLLESVAKENRFEEIPVFENPDEIPLLKPG